MVRPDEAQEVRLTASSNYKEVYESLLSISVDPTTGAPVVPKYAASHISPGIIPKYFRDVGVLQALMLACALTARPDECLVDGKLRNELTPTSLLWSVEQISSVALTLSPEIAKDSSGVVTGVTFWLSLNAAGKEMLVKAQDGLASARKPFAKIEIRDRKGVMPTHIVYSKYGGSGNLRSQYEFVGQISKDITAELINSIGHTEGIPVSFSDHRFAKKIGYLLNPGEGVPFSGSKG